jgi:hypothetical protein
MRPTLITVPAELADALREGVYAELRSIAEIIIQATQTAGHLDHPELSHQQRQRVEIHLDLAQHPVVLLAALAGARDDAADALKDVTAGRQTDAGKCNEVNQRAHRLHELVSAVEAQASRLA